MEDKCSTDKTLDEGALEFKSFTGNVLLRRGDYFLPVRSGDKLQHGDVLQVASASSVTLVLGDGRLWFSSNEQVLELNDDTFALIEQQAYQSEYPLVDMSSAVETGNVIFANEERDPAEVELKEDVASDSIASATRLTLDASNDSSSVSNALLILDVGTYASDEQLLDVDVVQVDDMALIGLKEYDQNNVALMSSGGYTLSRQGERDFFVWNQNDSAQKQTPSKDVLSGFKLGEAGDVLDLSDLLEGENTSNVTEYLTFSVVSGDSIMTIDPLGQEDFVGGYQVMLEGVDLSCLGGTNAAIANKLISDGNLQIDL